MLIGRYEHNLDSKSRLSFPAKIREALRKDYEEEQVILTSLGINLVAYPIKEWLIIEQKIRQAPNMEKSVSDFMRVLFSNASEVSFDKQGRILIPPHMKEKAGIDKAVVLVGVMNKIEIWAQERWADFEQSVELNHDKLASFGI